MTKVAPKIAPKGASEEQGVEKEVRDCIQRVMDKLTAIGPSDADVEHQIRECIQRIDELKMLQNVDLKAFNKAIHELQEISIGNIEDPTLSQGMAESILLEFDKPNPISSSRSAVEDALEKSSYHKEEAGNDMAEEFMGGGPSFVSLDEAQLEGDETY